MAARTAVAHVATTTRQYKDKVSKTHLLRRSYREGGTVKNETPGNLSHLPESLIEIIRRWLRGETFVPLGEAFEVLGSRPHGHVQAVASAMQRLNLGSLLGARPSPERERVLAMIAARIVAPHTKFATTRWWHTTTLAEDYGVADANENDLYAAMDWLLSRQEANGAHIHRTMCGDLLAHAEIADHNLRMNSGDYKYIWQAGDWPAWRFDLAALAEPMAQVSRAQGLLMGRLADVGMALRDQASLAALTDDVIKTSEIEGEQLNVESVRSSIARRLGVDIGALAPVDRHVEGVVEMVLDATANCQAPITRARLFGWHAALFPTGYSGLSRINAGGWRDDATGPMQVVSGPIGRQRVHFEAPPADRLETETGRLLNWVNGASSEPPLLKAGLGHLWFVTLHPFDDGNGRIARAIGDLLLARADGSPQRFYSLSAQIQRERKAYYDILERTQKRSMDVTEWLAWFLATLHRAADQAQHTLDTVLTKAWFWQRWATMPLNERQVKLLNRLLDGFEGKLTSSKWAVIAKCSSDTALRDINDLLTRGVLRKSDAGGRSTSYELNTLPE